MGSNHRHRMVRINVQLSPELKGEAEAWARKCGESFAEFIRRSVLERTERARLEERRRLLGEAYADLAKEYRESADPWSTVEVEGWPA